MHRWCLLNLTVQGFSLNLTVRGVSNKHCLLTFFILPSPIRQSVASTTADTGVPSSIPARSHTFMENDHEILSTVILLFPLIQEGLLSDMSKSMCMKYWTTA